MQKKYLSTTSRSTLESQDKLGTNESFEARTRGALSPFWTLVSMCDKDLTDPVIQTFIKDALPNVKTHQETLLELLKHSEEDRDEIFKAYFKEFAGILRSEFSEFASYLTSEWNCPDIDDDIIDEYLDRKNE